MGLERDAPRGLQGAAPHGATAGWAGLLRRLRADRAPPANRPSPADPDLRYRTLFECVSDGFALVEVIRDAQGRVVDYVVLEANPALLRILHMKVSPVGKRASGVLSDAPPAWLQACDRAMRGAPLTFEYHAPQSGNWFEIHLSRITETQLAHLVVDITDRKRSEHHSSEMFDELNHRVKNNLAIVSGMVTLQARATRSPEVRSQLETAVDRIQAIADVHASLYRTGRKDEVDFAAYLQDLCDRLRRSVLDPDRVTLRLEAEPTSLPLDKAVAMGVLVNELVTNAAKHAYPPPASGQISVMLSQAGEELVLSVGDSGCGLPAEPPPDGLGMRLVRSLVQQIGGALQVEHHPGATFRVRLPHTRQPPAQPGQAPLL
ncbi:MAG: sensor histidine kinase [Phenylobacterium sp.]|nr:sensor histidine kinase [Phenylobacterium sp.]